MTASAPGTAIVASWLLWWGTWLLAAVWRTRAVKRPLLRHEVAYRVLGTGGAVLLFGLYGHQLRTELILWRTPDAIGWGLAALVAAGLIFTWWARLHLGRLWSSSVTRKADHHVVETGPYGIVRHPIYAGLLFASVATAAMRGTALGWLGAGLLTVGFVIKARLEETFLREELGAQAYGEYARRVPMLAPIVRKRWHSGRRPH